MSLSTDGGMNLSQIIKNKHKRIEVLDGLKGIALIIVLGYYFMQHLVPGGFAVVNLFIFIAGILNFRHFHRLIVMKRPIDYKKYYLKRFSRLFFPMFFVMMLTAMLILFLSPENFYNLRNMGLASLFFVNNYYQISIGQSYFVQTINQSPFAHLWFSSLYAQLIVLTPILVFCCYQWHKKVSLAMNMLGIISVVSMVLMFYLSMTLGDSTWGYYDVFSRLSSYTLGGIMGLLLPIRLESKPIMKKQRWMLNIFGGFAFWLAWMMISYMYGTQSFTHRFGLSLFTILCFIIVFVVLTPGTIWHHLCRFKIFIWLGQRSYAYYLWFYPVMIILPNILKIINQNYGVYIIVCTVVTATLSELTYQLIELKKISLPFGQEWNWKKTKFQLQYLYRNKHALLSVKWLTGLYVVIILIGLPTILLAPQVGEGVSKTLVDNHQLVEETRQGKTENTIVINHIEGLDQKVKLYANALEVTFVGDSIFLASAQQLRDVFPKAVIDVQEGRQMYMSTQAIEQLKADNQLKPTVVTFLGTNGAFTRGQLEDYIESIGEEHNIYFVTLGTNQAWSQLVNDSIIQAAQRHGNVRIIDWSSLINTHPSWLMDEFHPNTEGALELAKLIANEVYRQR